MGFFTEEEGEQEQVSGVVEARRPGATQGLVGMVVLLSGGLF